MSKKYRWRKLGGGGYRTGNRIIKPGQVFIATEEEIPAVFSDLFENLGEYIEEPPVTRRRVKKTKDTGVTDDVTTDTETETTEDVTTDTETETTEDAPLFTLEDKGGGWWNVVDANGKPINEKGLRKKEAEELLANLV